MNKIFKLICGVVLILSMIIGATVSVNAETKVMNNPTPLVGSVWINYYNGCFEVGEPIKADIDYSIDDDNLDMAKVRFQYEDGKGNNIYLDTDYVRDKYISPYFASIQSDSSNSAPKGTYKLTRAEFTLSHTDGYLSRNYNVCYELKDNGVWEYYDDYSGLTYEVDSDNLCDLDSEFEVVDKATSPIKLVSLKSSLTSNPTYLTSGKTYTYTMRVKNVSTKNITYNLRNSYCVNGGSNSEYGYISMGYASLTSADKTLKPGETVDVTYTTTVGLANYTNTETTPSYFKFNFMYNNKDYTLFVDNSESNENEGASVSYIGKLNWRESDFNRSTTLETVKTAYYSYKVYKFKSMTLKSTSMTYTGKALKPGVTIKDTNGKVVGSNCYRVVYSNNTKVGKAKATLQFKNYDFENGKFVYHNYDLDPEKNPVAKKTFKINPVKTSITSLTKGTKAFTVKWAKKTTQTTGYEIQYSTSSTFKAGTATKKVTVTSNKTTSKTIKSLKAKKKYYVRVRTYKTVSGTKYYSAWCTKKYITT